LIHEYHQRGWSIIPIAHKSKNPNRPGWQNETFTPDDFPPEPYNVGIHLGVRSGWLVDIDLDHAHAVALAPEILPPTPAVFGRPSKPQSHFLYYATSPIDSKPYKSNDAGTIIEIRASGQSVFPDSTHPSGESITWDQWPAEPATIDPADLRDAVETVHRAAMAWLEMEKISIADGKDGSRRLHTCACRCVEHDLPDNVALLTISHYAINNPFPREWDDDEILQRIRDAEGNPKVARGSATGPQKFKLSSVPPEHVAEQMLSGPFTINGDQTLHSTDGQFLLWRGAHYRRLSLSEERSTIRRQLTDFVFHTRPAVANVRDALETAASLPIGFSVPGWLGCGGPTDLFACASGLVDLSTGEVRPPTPRFINVTVSPVAWEPDGEPPARWMSFLKSVWPNDAEPVRLLQQWFGYCLSADTRQQKMLLAIGPKRSGKGTIARVQRALLGADSVAGPTLSSIAQNFGLQPLIDKPLAIISDARLSARTDHAIVTERLLSISGEDALSIDRKNLTAVTMQLPTRIMVLTNEIPRLADASGALARRFVILRMTESFIGREDTRLTDALFGELPGILRWAVAGWRDLQKTGRFHEPKSSTETVQEMDDLTSPVSKFLRECCRVSADGSINCRDLYQAWCDWCQDVEHCHPGTSSLFGRDLSACLPNVSRRRVRDGQKREWAYNGLVLVALGPNHS